MQDTELLRFENITYRAGKKESLLNFSLNVKKGENIALFGPENSGIEIICPIIAGLIKEYEGEIYFKDKLIKSFDYIETHKYRKEIGYLQRDYGLISNMSVFENISLPLKYHSELSGPEIEDLVSKSIREMGLGHCRDQRPVNLTGSEKLKTAFLRSIILDPDLVLLEHSLERQCMFNVQALFEWIRAKSLAKTKSIIFVTYNPELFTEFVDRYIMLYNGNIVFNGSHTDFSEANNDYLKKYFKLSLNGLMETLR